MIRASPFSRAARCRDRCSRSASPCRCPSGRPDVSCRLRGNRSCADAMSSCRARRTICPWLVRRRRPRTRGGRRFQMRVMVKLAWTTERVVMMIFPWLRGDVRSVLPDIVQAHDAASNGFVSATASASCAHRENSECPRPAGRDCGTANIRRSHPPPGRPGQAGAAEDQQIGAPGFCFSAGISPRIALDSGHCSSRCSSSVREKVILGICFDPAGMGAPIFRRILACPARSANSRASCHRWCGHRPPRPPSRSRVDVGEDRID